jgi:ABC-type transport system involved in multi-copper enzyme maturation permease subunit
MADQIRGSNRGRPGRWFGIAVLGVTWYELRRWLTPMRCLFWATLMMFPVVLIATILYLLDERQPGQDHLYLAGLLFLLLPEVITVLCMLLWVAPIVNEELESQTWIYALVRPGGRGAVLLGKYIVAVLWTGTCTTCSTIICLILAWHEQIQQVTSIAATLIAINWIAAIAYGALFLLLGTLFQRRAMVISLVYAILIEATLGWLPAVINRFTVSFRLRSLLIDWLNVDLEELIDEELPFLVEVNATKHLVILATATGILILISLNYVKRSHIRWQSEV